MKRLEDLGPVFVMPFITKVYLAFAGLIHARFSDLAGAAAARPACCHSGSAHRTRFVHVWFFGSSIAPDGAGMVFGLSHSEKVISLKESLDESFVS